VKDISEIKNLQHQLETEKNYNRSIIENVNLGFVFVNDDNEYLDFNNEYLSITGGSLTILRGRHSTTLPRRSTGTPSAD
jgi:PAS domain-containing protein